MLASPPWAMQQKLKAGDLLGTINRGLPVRTLGKGQKRQDLAESWAGEIAGQSVLGPGWWDVRRLTAKGRPRAGVHAVPEEEIKPWKH